MSDPIWTPSLDDTELDTASARLRLAVRTALPELLTNEWRAGGAGGTRRIVIRQPPGLTLHLETTRMRTIVLDRRPVLEVVFRATVRLPGGTGDRPVELPLDGECRLDIDSGAIVHLRL